MKASLNTHRGPVSAGTRIRIIHLDNGDSPVDDSAYDGREGVVECIDDAGGMHGTWGGLAVFDTDKFEII